MTIDGKTKIVGIIGWPIEHTLSPAFHNAAFKKAKLNWVYLPLPVEPEHLGPAVEGMKALNFAGFNITMPHKRAVIDYIDGLTEEAKIIEAVNTVKREDGGFIGYNTDCRGFIESLRRDAGFDPGGRSALIVGAGGAARSVATALAMNGAAAVTIVNRTPAKARLIALLIKENFAGCEVKVLAQNDEKILSDIKRSQLIVNATSVGMGNNPGLPIAVDGIGKDHLIYDLIYSPPETEFLLKAKSRGARVINGVKMLLYQGMVAWEIWTGQRPPAETMAETLLSELQRRVF